MRVLIVLLLPAVGFASMSVFLGYTASSGSILIGLNFVEYSGYEMGIEYSGNARVFLIKKFAWIVAGGHVGQEGSTLRLGIRGGLKFEMDWIWIEGDVICDFPSVFDFTLKAGMRF